MSSYDLMSQQIKKNLALLAEIEDKDRKMAALAKKCDEYFLDAQEARRQLEDAMGGDVKAIEKDRDYWRDQALKTSSLISEARALFAEHRG